MTDINHDDLTTSDAMRGNTKTVTDIKSPDLTLFGPLREIWEQSRDCCSDLLDPLKDSKFTICLRQLKQKFF